LPEVEKPVRWQSSNLPKSFRLALEASLIVVFVICFLDLTGWIFNIAVFKSILPDWLPMNIITAITLLLAVSSLLLLHTNAKVSVSKNLPLFFAFIICLISLLTLYVHFYFTGTGHESTLTGVAYLQYILAPDNRMDLLISCMFLLFGVMIILLAANKPGASEAAHIIIVPVTLISYYIPVSYILGVHKYTEMGSIPMPLNTGIAFFALSVIVLLMRPQTWLLKVITSGSIGGLIARRLVPYVMFTPVIIGWLRIRGERSGLFESEIGVVLVAITYTVCFLIIIWFLARSVTNIDKKRSDSEEALRKSEAQLKELNATKDKFFNIIAHDLKNPFTSLLGSSELLYNNIDQMTIDNIKKLTLILNDSAKGGYAILQNLLDWSRSQTGILRYNPERINLKKLIDENISNLHLPAANKEINLYNETDDNIFIVADKNMVNTVLRNLLSNAVKFTHRQGTVLVGAEIESEYVIIKVKDTGIGISGENIKNLFRIDAKHSMPGTENEQGTGLGLKLCKEFVEKMGGKIWVESIENRGSEFKFSIPVKNDI
jgi:signal transduction histidine kinase